MRELQRGLSIKHLYSETIISHKITHYIRLFFFLWKLLRTCKSFITLRGVVSQCVFKDVNYERASWFKDNIQWSTFQIQVDVDEVSQLKHIIVLFGIIKHELCQASNSLVQRSPQVVKLPDTLSPCDTELCFCGHRSW